MSDRHDSKGQGKGPVNQHKRMAEGEKVTGMKKGGKVHDDAAEDKKMLKKMIKPESMKKLACGGMMKKGGMAKKKK